MDLTFDFVGWSQYIVWFSNSFRVLGIGMWDWLLIVMKIGITWYVIQYFFNGFIGSGSTR